MIAVSNAALPSNNLTRFTNNFESNNNAERLLDKTTDVMYSNFAPCRLLDCSVLPRSFCSNNSTILMHLNITSLNKHHDDLNELLLTLPFSPKVICLSEVRLKNELSQNLNMHGYKFIHKPSPTIVGGVAKYISSTCLFEIIHKYNLNIQGCEDLWIELTVNKVKRLIGVIQGDLKVTPYSKKTIICF